MVPRLDAGMGQFTCASATVDDGTTTREGNRFWLSAMAIAKAEKMGNGGNVNTRLWHENGTCSFLPPAGSGCCFGEES